MADPDAKFSDTKTLQTELTVLPPAALALADPASVPAEREEER